DMNGTSERSSGEGRKLARRGVSFVWPFSVKSIFELFLYMLFSRSGSTKHFRLFLRPVFGDFLAASTTCCMFVCPPPFPLGQPRRNRATLLYDISFAKLGQLPGDRMPELPDMVVYLEAL